MASHPSHDSDSNKTGLAVTSALFLGIMAIFFFALMGPGASGPAPLSDSDDLLKWPALSLSQDDLAARRAAFFGKPLEPKHFETPEFEALTKAFRTQNDHLFKTAPIPALKADELSAMFAQSVDAILPTLPSARAYGQLVDVYIPECQKNLQAILSDVQAGKLTMEQATQDPDIATYASYRQYCGNILHMLSSLGVVDPKGQWTTKDGEDLAALLQRMRWSRAGAPGVQEPVALSPSDKIAFTRWRVESDAAFTPKQAMQTLSRTPDAVLPYPKLQAQAILHMRAGRPAQAREALYRLAKQQPELSEAVAKTVAKLPGSSGEKINAKQP